jgi:hypothetical protein
MGARQSCLRCFSLPGTAVVHSSANTGGYVPFVAQVASMWPAGAFAGAAVDMSCQHQLLTTGHQSHPTHSGVRLS